MGQTIGHILYENNLRADDATLTLNNITEISGFDFAYCYDWKDFTSFRIKDVTGSLGTWYLDIERTVPFTFDSIAWLISEPGNCTNANSHQITTQIRSPGPVITNLETFDLYVDGFIALKQYTGGPYTIDPGTVLRIGFEFDDPTNFPVDIAQLAIGDELVLPIGQHVGIAPPAYQRNIKASNNISVGGSILGRDVVRKNKTGSIELEYLAESFISTSWQNFLSHAERGSFWYAWDQEDHPNDVVFAMATDLPAPQNSMPTPKMSAILPWLAVPDDGNQFEQDFLVDEFDNLIVTEADDSIVP